MKSIKITSKDNYIFFFKPEILKTFSEQYLINCSSSRVLTEKPINKYLHCTEGPAVIVSRSDTLAMIKSPGADADLHICVYMLDGNQVSYNDWLKKVHDLNFNNKIENLVNE